MYWHEFDFDMWYKDFARMFTEEQVKAGKRPGKEEMFNYFFTDHGPCHAFQVISTKEKG